MLSVRLLGEFNLCLGEARLPPLESGRAASLLAYLLLHRQAPQSRQHLAFLLWPDSTEPQARTNLRHVLHTLRRALPDPDQFIEATPRTLQWRADAPCWLDVAAFEEAVSRADATADGTGREALYRAVQLYAGDLLQGCYDDWVLGERERLRLRYLEALERLTATLEARGQYAEAISHAERLRRCDPLREEAYRLLMRLHAGRGDRARALRAYHICVATLERELGVEPSAPTREVYEALTSSVGELGGTADRDRRVGALPFVGRADEWSRLATLWRNSEDRLAQCVIVAGEPGNGKTRLVEEFCAWCSRRGAVVADARCYSAEGILPYEPVLAWLRSDGLKQHLRALDRAYLTELARLLPELFTTVPGLARPEPLPEDEQRQRLFEASARAIIGAGRSLLLVVDDLHWCDRETLQFLHYLLRVEPDARLLLVATARLEEIDYRHPLNELLVGLRATDRYAEIHLDRLTRAETIVLAEQTLGHPLAPPEPDRIYGETEGNPLFVVEAVRAGWLSGRLTPGWMSPRVQAAIESRLAQLSEQGRAVIGLAATIGREFSTDLLIGASEASEDEVVDGLDELWRRRIVREQEADAYDFSHDKIRDVAYLALSPPRRRHYHRRIARTLERLHADDPDPVSGQLATHYERAGLFEQAVTWYVRAAGVAQRLSASVEAIQLLGQALSLLRALPATPDRQTQELAILAALSVPLGWVDGWASERLASAQWRALELTDALRVELMPPLLRSLALASLSRRDYASARGFGESLRTRGKRDADEVLLIESDYVLGVAAFWQGEFATARDHFEAVVRRHRPEYRRAHLLQFGSDPMVICLSRLANTLWFLGYPALAVRARDDALAAAEDPFSRTVVLVFAAMLALEMHDTERIRIYETILMSEQAERPLRPNQGAAEHFGGYVDVLDGRIQCGLARIQRALDDSHQVDHAPGLRARTVRVLLEACVVGGDARTGLAAADRALASDGADRLWEAETRRLRAEFLSALGAPLSEVEAELDRALQVARRQGAVMLELRAAISLLRFRSKQRGPATLGARDQLAAIMAALPEARDCWEMRSAIGLLDGV